MQIIRVPVSKKSGSLAAFFSLRFLISFCLGCWCSQAIPAAAQHQSPENLHKYFELAQQKNLARHPVWSGLLHVSNGRPNIYSHQFLLTADSFSLVAELNATLKLLYGGERNQQCRFPARYLWLRQQLDLPELSLQDCTEFQEFKTRAPATEISLAFASENLAQPSSMMGHIFLKLRGLDSNGNPLEHAISFFTDAGGINISKLFYESMVVGKTGYFSLSPYQEKIALYLGEEQRSIWEYSLKLSAFQKELIQAHLIELRQTDLVYFFQKYNCATVIDFVLSLAATEPLNNTGFWLTPKDVVKRAEKLNLIEQSRLISPNRWLIRALREQLPSDQSKAIQEDIDALRLPEVTQLEPNQAFLHLQLAKAYLAYQTETTKFQDKRLAVLSNSLKSKISHELQEKYPSHVLQVLEQKNPIESPQDSQIAIGLTRRDEQTYLRMNLTPASHQLDDDNRQYFSETELLLFDVSILKDLRSRQILLDQFTVYSAKSLIPYDAMSGGISGAFRIGVAPHYDAQLRSNKAAFIEGGLGITHRAGNDLDSFALLGLGVRWQSGRAQLYAQPEIGFILREVFDMKSRISVVMKSDLAGNDQSHMHFRFVQSKYFKSKDVSLHLSIDRIRSSEKTLSQFEFSLKKMF
jgi:hypothetical protein